MNIDLSPEDVKDLLRCINRQWEIQTRDPFYERLMILEDRLDSMFTEAELK